MKVIKLITAAIMFFSLHSAHAELQVHDSKFGKGTITYDTETNISWLDVTVSQRQSFDEVTLLLNTTYKGYRLASPDELLTFFSHGNVTEGSIGTAFTFMNEYWGMVSDYVSYAYTNGLGTRDSYYKHVTYGIGGTPYGPSTIEMYYYHSSDNSWQRGSALIMDGIPVSSVPEPSLFAMLLAGLGAAAIARFFRQAA